MSGSRTNWAALGILRFFLAFLVAGHHMTGTVHDGTPYLLESLDANTAVDVFFVISGFSMAASFQRESNGFYRRRFWRVVPMYWTGILLAYGCFLWFGPVISEDFGSAWWFPGWGVFFYQFFFLQPIIGHHMVPLNAALWSLGVEMAFYLLVPLLAKAQPGKVAIAAAVSALLAITLARNIKGPVFNILLYAQCFWGFAAGWLFYPNRMRLPWKVGLVVGLTLVVLLKGHRVESLAWLTMLLGSAAVAFSDQIKTSPLSSKIFDYLGDLSFPLYALHWPIGWILNFMNLNWPLQLALPTAIAGAMLALHLIDRPLRALGRSRPEKRTVMVSAEAVP